MSMFETPYRTTTDPSFWGFALSRSRSACYGRFRGKFSRGKSLRLGKTKPQYLQVRENYFASSFFSPFFFPSPFFFSPFSPFSPFFLPFSPFSFFSSCGTGELNIGADNPTTWVRANRLPNPLFIVCFP